MKSVPLSKTKIETKLATIRVSLTELKVLAALDQKTFLAGKQNFPAAEHYLRRSLEALFDICGHVVSRFPFAPNKRPDTYKGLALALAQKGICSETFAKNRLVKMAGYRNRLVHFYDEISEIELFNIIQNDLNDFKIFGKKIAELLQNPQKLGLTVES